MEKITVILLMCKKGIAVLINGQAGRIHELRVNKTEQKFICTFVGRNETDGRTIEVSKVKPANNKAAANLDKALEKLKIIKHGIKVSPS